jgi:hypothetical protein
LGEKTFKLNLLFIVMELLTLMAYPLVFVHGKLRQLSKSRESSPVQNLFVSVPFTRVEDQSEILNMRKKGNHAD